MRKAIVQTATGLVVNVIELKPGAQWTPPDGCQVRNAGKCGPGWSWNGRGFVPPISVIPSRMQVLANSPTFTVVDNIEVPKDETTLASERVELLGLLHDKLQADPDSLTIEETRKMLQLERWS